MKPMSLRTFSQIAGVSPATVSRVFSNSARVAPEKKARILELAEATGFRPNPIARAAFGATTKSIGVLICDLGVEYFGEVANGIQHALIQEGYLAITVSERDNPEQTIKRMLDHRVDGLIIGHANEQYDLAGTLGTQGAHLPIVVMEHPIRGLVCDTVFTDDIGGGQQAAEYLTGLGHTRIGFVYFGNGRSNCDDRLRGFCEVLARKGLLLPEKHIFRLDPFDDNREQRLRADLVRGLTEPDAPTAIFAGTDLLAVHVYKAAQQAGRRIPQDLSLIGFANMRFTSFLAPELTTIAQNPFALGTTAAELILARLNGEPPAETHINIPTRLVIRESCAQPA